MIAYRRAVASDAERVSTFFRQAGSTCFCRYLHFQGDKNDWLGRCAEASEDNRSEMESAVVEGRADGVGVIAVENDAVVGWMKVAPACTVTKAYDQRLYRGLPCLQRDASSASLLGCALVLPSHRRRGVARGLVRAAIELARARGTRVLEALPRTPRGPVSDEELWTLPTALLVDEGFKAVGGEEPYPVLRLEL